MQVTVHKEKKELFSKIYGYESKTSETGDIIKGGYIATTHLDSGFYDETRSVYVRDKIQKETLDRWATEINSGNPRANKVSVNHVREKEVTGVGLKGTAKVEKLPDGEYGLYVDTLIDKTKYNFEDVNYKLEKGILDSFSIEFTTRDMSTGEYLDGAAKEMQVGEGTIVRQLLPGTVLEGWTLASQPMNEYAIMIKEVKKMSNEQIEIKPEPANVGAEVKTVDIPQNVVETKEDKITSEDRQVLEEIKEQKKKDMEGKKMLENKEEIMKELKEEIKGEFEKLKVETKVQNNPGKIESKEYREYKEALSMKGEKAKDGRVDYKTSVSAQFKVAGKLADSLGLTMGRIKTESKPVESREYKNFSTNGSMLEFKGLGLTTNQNSDTDYLLSAAELSDVFDPVVYNALNQATVTWNLLAKEDFSMKGNNQVQFTLKTAANTSAAAYLGNAINLGNVTRMKYQTKFKKYAVGVEVDGDMIAAAKGGPLGDVFAQEVADSTDDLLAVMNLALFAEVGLETASGVIGFEYIADSAGNTSLYNVTRSATNKLAPDAAGDTYINGASADLSLANMRAAIRQAVNEGANLNNLVFITNQVQVDKLKSIYDAMQRLMPTSSRFGFEGRPSFDGVPIFADKDCTSDNVFLIDLETVKIGIWVPPSLEMLGKDSDSNKGFVKTYWCTYYRAPRRVCMIYDNATA